MTVAQPSSALARAQRLIAKARVIIKVVNFLSFIKIIPNYANAGLFFFFLGFFCRTMPKSTPATAPIPIEIAKPP